MSKTVGVLTAHQYNAAERSCSCDQSRYDAGATIEQNQHEHALHVEKELADAGVGEIADARTKALNELAEAIDGDAVDSFYSTRKRELSVPYSKPMFPEQWGQLDGIESTARFIRERAAAERNQD